MPFPEPLPIRPSDPDDRAAVEHLINEWAAVARAILLRRRQP